MVGALHADVAGAPQVDVLGAPVGAPNMDKVGALCVGALIWMW